MRTSAAQVADAVLLIVAADEGVLLQTKESIGPLEEAGLIHVICINKVDFPALSISGKTGPGLDDLRTLHAGSWDAEQCYHVDAEGRDVKRALPGTVVDITYSNKLRRTQMHQMKHGFFVSEARAREAVVIGGQRTCLESECAFSPMLMPEADDVIDENDLIETKSIIVVRDGAGSLASIQDTVDEMSGILASGNISVKDIDVAINGKCPIFGFNVKLRTREAKLATERGVRVILRSTVHELIEEVTAFEQLDATTSE
ncbi:unnamed protein product [Peronospora destructor]|uniref:Tr-type G domain-containing protein n=1 Tax=Peronospora destructor TaxID=86335 RepID=A0AAV0VCM2_9STRA|nr:unnamed protein product [Peronospora destructor]